MSRLFLALAVAPALLAAPAPKVEKVAAVYFPTAPDSTKIYELKAGGETLTVTETVTKVETKDGLALVSVARAVEGAPATLTVTEVSANGLRLMVADGEDYGEPAPLLMLPARAGQTWAWKRQPAGAGTARATYTAGPEEEVEVPAGKFRALRVDSKVEVLARSITTTHWYAPGVGLVKMVSKSAGVERVQVLKAFTPGK